MKKAIIGALCLVFYITANAQTKLPSWLNNVKLSGFGMFQYQYNGKESDKNNTFNIKLARTTLEGRVLNDFYWKTQWQLNGNTSNLTNSPRMIDLFVEWQKYDFARIKLGQFKVAFSFENHVAPIEQGFMGYSQAITKLVSFSDISGKQASNGADIGVQVQGSFLKNSQQRNLIGYQIGVYNGQGINTVDADNQKDIAGGLWIMPIKGMRIGAFGWTGTYARKGTLTYLNGTIYDETLPLSSTTDEITSVKTVRSLRQNRYAISADYVQNDWIIRTEYIHSTGESFATSEESKSDASNLTVNKAKGNEADAAYASVIAPVIKGKLYAKARYDMYRPTAQWNQMKTQYEAGLNYKITNNLQLWAEYALVNDRSLPTNNQNYSIIDVELSVRF